MTKFLRLIRLPNLIIIALTMCGVRYGLLETIWLETSQVLQAEGFSAIVEARLHMKGFDFFMLMASVLLIAAGGYIINDYFDVKADRINKKHLVVLDSSRNRRLALASFVLCGIIGILLGLWVALRVGNWKLVSIQLFSFITLWFYSSHLKKQMLSGNLLIALLAALVPFITGLYELLSKALPSLETINLLLPGAGTSVLSKGAALVLGFALFAFLSNLIREIIKDTEDIPGDLEAGCRTLPIVIGENPTRYVVLFFIFFTSGLLGFVQQYLFRSGMELLFWFLMLAIQLPLLVLAYLLWNAQQRSDYSKASFLSKLIIVCGVLSMFLFRYQ
ncbi:MAG: geranylgeranylglycerol-phosphate geranylgeranyltransferase [Bacteroidia bacterium]|jgi:4-hydroxybenzoate polyprenyltransferase|nr:geranylgeranylglycerol-phosphate geranylgeranyltransferase [Bacteroidia bacterium]MCC6768097.1 geranylgeranylglycerol-phosphate geranylgeranyltransferase [Bacteroidia bacterium]